MKATLFVLPALLPMALGYSIVKARDLKQEDVQNAAPMTFTGPLTVGGKNVTITGTVESVWAQILEKNPKYDAWEFPEYRERMEEQGITRESKRETDNELSKRDWITCTPEGGYVGQWNQCVEGVGYLMRLNGYCGAPAGWGGCSRVSCSHSCGIFLCNDNPFPINVWCGNLAGDANDIGNECQDVFGRIRGQVFRDQAPGWNTIIKDQSC